MSTVLRIGIVGLGRIGRLHAELVAREVAGARLVAVADADPEVAARAAGLGVQAGTDPLELLARDDVDAVAVCTPTPTHVDLVAAAAKAGKAILCEKPLSLDLGETERAIEAAESAGVPLQVGFNRRFDPGHGAVRAAIAAGEVGTPEIVRITSRDPAPPTIEYLRSCGGLFLDQTIHDLDMARFVTGSEVTEVYAAGAVRVDEAISDLGDHDTAAVTLRHADGCLTLIDNSRRAGYGYDQRVEVLGSTGMAASDNQPVHGALVRTAAGARSATLPWFFLERYRQSYLRQWEAFVAACSGRHGVPVSGADARAALVAALAATLSAGRGRPVATAEIGG